MRQICLNKLTNFCCDNKLLPYKQMIIIWNQVKVYAGANSCSLHVLYEIRFKFGQL